MVELSRNKKITLTLAFILITLSVAIFSVFQWKVKDVSVTINGQEAAFRSTEGTVGELFTKEKLSLDKEDYLNVELDRKLYDGMDIIIRRAVPVKVAFDNKEIETKTASETVRELLDKLNIEYDGDDKVTPGLDEEITSNLGITVIKVEEKFEIHKEEIPYKTVTKNNSDLEKGKSKVLQDGKAGVKEIKTKLVYEDGVVIAEEVIDEYVVQESIEKVVENGTKDLLVSSRGNLTYKRSLTMKSTAYDLSYESTGKRPGDKYYGITASGTKARPGTVAVDPKVIPLGTKLYIESLDGSKDYGFAIAEDTGGAIKGEKIDLFFESSQDVKKYGVRKVKVYILGK